MNISHALTGQINSIHLEWEDIVAGCSMYEIERCQQQALVAMIEKLTISYTRTL